MVSIICRHSFEGIKHRPRNAKTSVRSRMLAPMPLPMDGMKPPKFQIAGSSPVEGTKLSPFNPIGRGGRFKPCLCLGSNPRAGTKQTKRPFHD